MQTFSAKVGYILEGDKPGHFYNRLGQWAQYGSVPEGFVWSEEEVAAINAASAGSHAEWDIKPKAIHPAIYDDRTGVTVVTDAPKLLSDTQLQVMHGIAVPHSNGKVFDIESVKAKLGVNMVARAMASL